jgi:ABC-type branched-subunit amino acid transport system substrate-binding protein
MQIKLNTTWYFLLILMFSCPIMQHLLVAQEDSARVPDIKLGMSTVLSGPTANLGINMRDGVLAAFDEANRAGGVQGRKLRLVALDDGYEPQNAISNIKKLILDEHVETIIGNVGTPTAVVSVPIALENKVPFYGAFTGAGILRKTPPDRYVWNFRAGYKEETSAMVNALISNAGLKPEEIGFFSQRDAYGDAGFGGGMEALHQKGLKKGGKILHVRYERNTLAVEEALATLLTSEPQPKALIMIGAYAPCAKFIKLASENSYKPIFLNVSFVGSDSLCKELGATGEGVVITQVVPHFDANLSGCHAYLQALKALNGQLRPSFGSLEGYLAARILIKTLHTIKGEIGRETINGAFEHLGEIDLGIDVPLLLNEKSHQASQKVWPTIIKNGKIIPFDWNFQKTSENREGSRP